MRLIYADALKEVFKEKSSEAVCGVELCKAIINQIDNQPTVEAIPVEWIQRKIDMLEQNMDSYLPKPAMLAQLHELVSLKRLVTDWEKEKWEEE